MSFRGRVPWSPSSPANRLRGRVPPPARSLSSSYLQARRRRRESASVSAPEPISARKANMRRRAMTSMREAVKRNRIMKIGSKSMMNLSNRNILFYILHAKEVNSGLAAGANKARAIYKIPESERKILHRVFSSPIVKYHLLSNESLRLIKKHSKSIKVLVPTANLPSNNTINKYLEIPVKDRIRIEYILKTNTPASRLKLSNLTLLYTHKNLIPTNKRNAVVSEMQKRVVIPFAEHGRKHFENLRAREQQQAISNVNRMTSTRAGRVQGAMAIEGQQATTRRGTERIYVEPLRNFPPAKSRLTNKATMNNVKLYLSRKNLNNENVQSLIRNLKAYRANKYPRENNAPNAPNKPERYTTIQQRKNYEQSVKNYNEKMRGWIISMAAHWKRNNP